MEASGHAGWFERLLAELNFELWMGDAAKIAARRVRKQKTDRLDALRILTLTVKDDFQDLGAELGESGRATTALASPSHRADSDANPEPVARQEEVVAGGRTAATGVLTLSSRASRRRHDLLDVLDRINPTIAELTHAIEQKVKKCPETSA